MNITLENILWIIGGLGLAAAVVFGLVSFGISAMQRTDIAVLDIQAYSDGTVYLTIKNVGTVPVTAISVDGTAATGTLPLDAGQESQYKVTGLSLTAGDMHQFTIVATFSNGQTKELRVKAIVKS